MYYNLRSKWHIKHYNSRKTSRAARIWKICCWIHFLAWINHSCNIIHKLFVLVGSLHYVQCVPYAAILQIFLLFSRIWYCWNQLPAVSKQRDVRWRGFRWSIPLSIDNVWNSSIDRAISTPSCYIAYEIDTAKIIAAIFRISYWLHYLIRLNSIVCHVQTARCKMMRFTLIDSDINGLCLKCVYGQGYLDFLILMLHMK